MLNKLLGEAVGFVGETVVAYGHALTEGRDCASVRQRPRRPLPHLLQKILGGLAVLVVAALVSLGGAGSAQAATCTLAYSVAQNSSNNIYTLSSADIAACDPDQQFQSTAAFGNSVDGSPMHITTTQGGTADTVWSPDRLRYTPPTGFSGTDTFQFEGSSGNFAVTITGTVTVTVVGATPAPVTTSFTYGTAIPYNTGAASATTFTLSGNATNSPTGYAVGASAHSATVSVSTAGLVSYTPPAGYRGSDSFTFTASNAGGTSNTSTVTVNVANPTFSVTLPSATGTVGTAYNSGAAAVTMSGGKSPYSSFSATGLPAGLSINSSGVISGTPTATTTATVVVTATDSSTGTGAYTSTASATLTISNPPAPVASSFTASAVAYNSASNSFSVAGHATNSPTSYAVGSATTANGGSVSVNSAGTVTYTAPTGFRGNDSFTFTASNAGGTSSAATVTVPVNNPTFSVTLPSATGTVGTAYNSGAAAVTMSGGQSPYSSFSATGLPAGLSISSSGVISGTPTATTTATVVVTATDSSTGTGPYTSTASATLTISNPAAPVASSFTASAVAYNSASNSFSVAGHATNSPTSYAVGSATTANGGSVSVNSAGTVTYTAPTGFRGNDSFTFTASNAGGTSSAATVTVPVNNPTFGVTLPASTATVGVAYNSGAAAVTLSGGQSPYSSFSATGLPAGLSISSSGVISGTPTAVTNATVVVTATDSSTGTGPYTSTASASLNVGAPTVTLPTTSLSAGTGGVAYSATLAAATGGTGPYSYALTAGALPAGVSFNASTRVVSGTPTATGTFSFSVTATDSSTGTGAPFSATQSYSLTIAAPTISLATASLPNGATATAYSQSLPTATGGVSPYSYSVTSGALPGGVGLSSAGLISGTPTAGGTFNFGVTATDSSTGAGPYTGGQSYSLTIGAPTITISPTSLTGATAGAAYSQTLTASGGVSSYSFAVTGGALPAGVSLSSGGVLSGAPTAAGSFSFTVTAADSSGGAGPYAGQRTYGLTVAAPSLALAPTSLPNPTVGTAYSQTVTASGGTASYSYAVTSGALPAGLSLNTGAGVVSGTPTASGAFNFSITATDSTTGTGSPFQVSRSYGVTVAAPTVILPATSLSAGTTGTAYSATLNAATGGTSPYSYAVTAGALPAGVGLSSSGGLSGTPTAAGAFNFTVTATDSSAGAGPYTASRAYSLTIGAPTVTLPATTLSNATSGAAYSATLNVATGGISPYSYAVTAGALPAGVGLSSSGVLSGTPTATGTFNITVTATDSSTGTGAPFSGARNYSLTVNVPTVVLAPTSLTAATQGVSYSQTISASGGVAPYSYAVTAGALPAGLSLAAGGALTGAPTVHGAFTFTVTATDSSSGAAASAGQSYTLTVNVPVAPTAGATTANVAANSSGNAISPVLGGGAADSVAIVGAASHGVATASGLTLSYTPTAGYSGSDSFTYTATNAGGVSAAATVTVTVGAPTLTVSGAPPAGMVAVAYAATTFIAANGATPYSFTATGLPGGLTLSTAGVLSGTPTAAGAFTLHVTATDAHGATGAQDFPVTVTAPTVTITAPAAGSLPGATAQVAYSQAFTASGGFAPYSFTVTAGALPPGLTLSSGGALSGAPTMTGTYTFSITPRDGAAAPGPYAGAAVAYSLTVAGPNLTLSPSSLPTAPYGDAYSQTFTATGGTAPYSFALTGALPAGMSFNTGTGVLSGSPTDPGSYPLTVSVTDSTTGAGAPFTVSHAITLTVAAAVPPVADPATVSTPADASTTIDVSSMIDGDYDSVVIVNPPSHGTAVVNNGSGLRTSGIRAAAASPHITIIYTPNPGYYGADSFTYAASGPGGTSAPAAISVAVATPAPVTVNDTASTAANQVVSIPVTANDTGPLDTIAIATVPSHGAAVVSGLSVTYTPATDFFGTDSFTYTATGPGGTSAPATVTVTVTPLAPPAAPAKTLAVLAGASGVLAATADATGGPFTAVAVATAPSAGTATVSGLTIVYAPGAGFSGVDHFSYTLANAYGVSQPIPVTVTVNALPLVAPPITLNILAGQTATTSLTAAASGGPFSAATVVSMSPASAGTTTITSPTTGAYSLSFKPANDFAGTVTISYTLTNPFATSAPGTVTVIVTARPDPSADPEVQGLVAAQDAAARRFANAQISNFNRRLEQLHNGGGSGGAFGISLQGGNPDRPDGLEARERFRRYAQLGQNDGPIDRLSLLPVKDQDQGGGSGPTGPDGKPSRWGVWVAGSADFGMRDAIGAQSGFRFTTDGLTAGADYRVNAQLAIGAGLGYGQDSSRIGHLGTKSQAQSYSGGVYASYQPAAGLFVDGLAGYGTLDFSTRRHVTTTGDFLYGDRDGDQVFASVTAGFEHRGGAFMISPYGRLGATRSQLDAYSEVGGGPYGLTYQSQKVNTVTGTLGLRGDYAYKVSFGQVQPRFRIEYAHDFEGADSALINYADWVGGPTYKLAVDPTDRNQTRVELGMDILVQGGLKIGVDFDNTVSSNSDSQGLRIVIGTPF